MAKVRVYDLAKEFGMKSKELADRLIEMGYPIASHSSSVEDDMAADIRRKLGGGAPASGGITVAANGRIEARGRAESGNPWGGTVVRRRSKADKEEAARQQELAEARALEEEEARLAAEEEEEYDGEVMDDADGMAGVEFKSAASEDDDAGPAEIDAEDEEDAEPAPPVEDEADAAEAEPAAVAPAETAPPPRPERGERAERGERGEAKRDKGKVRKVVRPGGQPERPRPLAKVVGRVEIPQSELPSRGEPQRGGGASRPAGQRPGGGRPASGSGGGRPAAPMPDMGGMDAGRGAGGARGSGKKKGGRRVVAIAEDDALDRRAARGGRKGRGGREDYMDAYGGMGGDEGGDYARRRSGGGKGKKKKDMRMEAPQPVAETKAIKRRIKVVESITVGDLARHMSVKAGEVITALMKLGVMASLNQSLDVETAQLVATDFGFEVEQAMHAELELEAGGITQHIGAYHVQNASGGGITFVDTPGHAAFTEMRSRGAKVTDIVVLVVAADDGVMDQTKEAIAHAQAADVPIVVAVNKIDKDGADPERVRRELSDFGLIPEAWGGQTIYCETSAKKGVGIPELLESIQIQAEILELKADPARKAKGVVIEAQLHKGRGPVATVLVQEGTLRPGDNFVAGIYSGKVRSLTNERGEMVAEAGPAIPVEVQGLSGVPQAGDAFMVLTDERMAKSVASARQLKARESELAAASRVSLDNLFEKMAEQDMKELRVILRADVQGTLEAFGQAAQNLSTEAIRVKSLHEGTGSITENDIHLAAASDAIVIGFNVRPSVKVQELAAHEGVDVRSYDVIYHALEDIEKAMKGMLEPTFEERVIGTAEVRDTFQVPKVGLIAGCGVIAGKVQRNARVRVLRDGVVVYTGKISSLKRFKDDVKEVLTGFECGIGVENFNDIKVGDQLEAFVMDEVEATL